MKDGDDDASVAVVIEVLPPEQNTTAYGQEMDGEAVNVAFPEQLDEGPGDWREIHPAKLASYCDDQDIKLYTYKHTNLKFAENPFTPGDYVIKPDYEDPDLAVVLTISEQDSSDKDVTVAFVNQLDAESGSWTDMSPRAVAAHCEELGINSYSYAHADLCFEPQY
jgi:hypothetical protein